MPIGCAASRAVRRSQNRVANCQQVNALTMWTRCKHTSGAIRWALAIATKGTNRKAVSASRIAMGTPWAAARAAAASRFRAVTKCSLPMMRTVDRPNKVSDSLSVKNRRFIRG